MQTLIFDALSILSLLLEVIIFIFAGYLCCKFKKRVTKSFRVVSFLIFICYVLEVIITIFNFGYEISLWKMNQANIVEEDRKFLTLMFVISIIFNIVLVVFFVWLSYISWNLNYCLKYLKEEEGPKCARPIQMRDNYVSPSEEVSDLVPDSHTELENSNQIIRVGGGQNKNNRTEIQKLNKQNFETEMKNQTPLENQEIRGYSESNPYQAPQAGFLSYELDDDDESRDKMGEAQKFYVANGLSGKKDTIPNSRTDNEPIDSQDLEDVLRFKEKRLDI